MDVNYHWRDYRRKSYYSELLLQDKKDASEPLICYYKLPQNGAQNEPIVIMEINTGYLQLILWIILPGFGIVLCWVCIPIVYLWYCCPHQRKSKSEDYRQITGASHDPAGVKQSL